MAEAKNQFAGVIENRHNLSLFIFRRDLRLVDNTALISALSQSKKVIAVFIFDPRQIETHSYLSKPALQFMLNSLLELQSEIKKQKGALYFLHGTPEEVIPKLVKKLDIEAIFFNRDYTPFSKNRDEAIGKFCEKNQLKLHIFDDAVLQKPEAVLKNDGKPYTIFTPYRKKARTFHVPTPQLNSHQNYYAGNAIQSEAIKEEWWPQLKNLSLQGGRKEGIRLLNAVNALSNYSENRNYPAKNETSHLSAHIKFGTVSIRECYYHFCATFSPEHTLINELYWHDFFTQIGHYFPHVFSKAFQEKYQRIRWKNNKAHFKRWCEGRTGFPIVDAGMRELNQTGYMHNRVRMIVASFLTKDLLISWRWGEVYFAQQLIDYDPCVNNGNWQWAASTGCDAQPYFRIFNPWLQQEKFDADCLYIKKWLPELADLPPKTIHRLFLLEKSPVSSYPTPMLDHKSAAQRAIQLYKK
jgi:deoxyribodipyrimidine photo-lyase